MVAENCVRQDTYMARKSSLKQTVGPNSIRGWREAKGLTLQRLADRLEDLAVGITAASLSRIERSIQPYNQHQLEGIALALNCEPADLVMRAPPTKDQVELFSIIRGLGAEQSHAAVIMLRAFAGVSAAASAANGPEAQVELPARPLPGAGHTVSRRRKVAI